jgi:alkyl hydroperoxide reductase subunit AhpC
MLRINDEAPNFTAETSQGPINFHDWIGNGWAILFSHPGDPIIAKLALVANWNSSAI